MEYIQIQNGMQPVIVVKDSPRALRPWMNGINTCIAHRLKIKELCNALSHHAMAPVVILTLANVRTHVQGQLIGEKVMEYIQIQNGMQPLINVQDSPRALRPWMNGMNSCIAQRLKMKELCNALIHHATKLTPVVILTLVNVRTHVQGQLIGV